MRNIKKAFTIAEIMIVMAILAIIIAAFMQTNPFAPKYQTLYYYTLKNLKKFSGENIAVNENNTPYALSTVDASFCNYFIRNLNTVGGDTTCSKFFAATASSPFSGMLPADINTPSFTLSNGQRFYVSARQLGPPAYRVISVDLNGLSNPNAYNKDIVPFVIFDSGEVLPIGDPINDRTYVSTMARTCSVNNGQPTGTILANASGKTFLTFREGFCISGAPSLFAGYCPGTLPLVATPAIATDAACVAGNTTTYCRYDLIKPVINIKI